MSATNYHPVVCFGEALWTIFPTGKQAGGAPVHVAYHLQKLGINPALISRIGYDDPGKELIEVLEKKGICTDYFQMDDEKPTGVSTAYVKEGCETVYTIYNEVAWDGIEYADELATLVSNAGYFVFGSLAARCKNSYQTLQKLLYAANNKVLHINLCAPFYNRVIIEYLLNQADIIKLSLPELELITGWFSNYKDERDRIKILNEKFNIPVVAVTEGKRGSVLYMNNNFYEYSDLVLQRGETTGRSEAFLAGLLFKFLQNAGPVSALEYAAATVAVTTRLEEPFPEYSKVNIDSLIDLKTTGHN